jgi:hypothetical protein
VQIDDGQQGADLLPVGIWRLGAGGELDLCVGAIENNVEPGEEGVYVVVPVDFQRKVRAEGEVLLLRCPQVDRLRRRTVSGGGND